MASRLEDYALIGDLHTAALVGRDGSIDWLCLPRFDSPACFGALLGTPEHGRWLLAPPAEVRTVRRRYREDSLVLETEYTTADGVALVVDYMPVRTEAPTLVRRVEGRRGQVPMAMDLAFRLDYGATIPWVQRTPDGLSAIAGPDRLRLVTPAPLRGEGFHTVSHFTVGPGDVMSFVLSWHPSHLSAPESPAPSEDPVRETERWWRQWSARCSYDGPYREAVVRSLITLKALTFAPTGGMVAAATTSLPEQLGGTRNWDYRYCWLRDATFVLYALTIGGYDEESRAWQQWLLRAVAGTPAQAQILYGVAGERLLPEWEVAWLPGYEGAAPVRIGNAAHTQLQLDVFGEVMDALHFTRRVGLDHGEEVWRVQTALVEFVEHTWQEPDHGIWEMRGKPRHFTHSKVMAWVALDRAVKAVERWQLPGPVERWRATREAIHADICRHGFDPDTGTFIQAYDWRAMDAALLMLPLVGFLPATDPRMIATVEAIQRELGRGPFVARYRTHPDVDALPPGEGAFLPCTFWLADNLALQGRGDEARQLFEHLLGVRNDVGLLSEEYDPGQRRLVGNFPQALSHMALVNTAENLSPRRRPAEHRAER